MPGLSRWRDIFGNTSRIGPTGRLMSEFTPFRGALIWAVHNCRTDIGNGPKLLQWLSA